jgi:glycosyltransferase involved in cell wall biosynthesis
LAKTGCIVDKIRVILISSVRPANTSGGEIVLYRHLVNQPGIKLEVYGDEPKEYSSRVILRRLVGKLGQTKLRRFAEDFWVFWQGTWLDSALPMVVPEPQRTVVMTVAHGDGFMAARRFARQHGLALVSFFHDWWPDMAEVHGFARKRLEQEFRRLAAESAIAFCVSEGMRRALGYSACRVLAPLPASRKPARKWINSQDQSRKLKLHYSGNLAEYGPMLGELLKALEGNDMVELIVRGKRPQWSSDFAQTMRNQGKWLDIAPRDELEAWLAGADAFLIPMAFDLQMRRRMETSFPSKLIEFVQFGRPLVIWGPEYCSAVQWGRHDNRAFCVTDQDPLALVNELDKLAISPERVHQLSEAAIHAANYVFSPAAIQNSFRAMLFSLVGQGYLDPASNATELI